MPKIELHYGPHIPNLLDALVYGDKNFISNPAKYLFIVKNEKRSHFLKRKYLSKKSQTVLFNNPFISEEKFILNLYERLNIPFIKLKYETQLFILWEVIRQIKDQLQYFNYSKNNYPFSMVKGLLSFFEDVRLDNSSCWLNGEKEDYLSGDNCLFNDLKKIYKSYEAVVNKKVLDKSEILKLLIKMTTKDFWAKHFPDLKTIIWEDSSKFKQLHLDFAKHLKEMGFDIKFLFVFSDNQEIFSTKAFQFKKLKECADTHHYYSSPTIINQILFQLSDLQTELSPKISIRPSIDSLHEIENLAGEIKKIVIEKEKSYSAIGICTPNLAKYWGLIKTVFSRHRIPVHLSGGMDLGRSLIFQHIFFLWKIIIEDYPLETLKQILQSPFFRYREMLKDNYYLKILTGLRVTSGKENILYALERERDFYFKNLNIDDSYEYQAAAYEGLIYTIKHLFNDLKLLETRNTFAAIVAHLKEFLIKNNFEHNLLQKLKEDSLSWVESHFSATKCLFELLSDCATVFEHMQMDAEITPQQFSQFLNNVGEFIQFNLRRPVNFGVQCLPLNQLHEFEPEYLFIIGMEETEFPFQENIFFTQSQFFPKELNVLLPHDSLFEQRELFLQILDFPAKEVIFSYPRYQQDNPLLPSVFLKELNRISPTSLEKRCDVTLYSPASLLERISKSFQFNLPDISIWSTFPGAIKKMISSNLFEIYCFREAVVSHRSQPDFNPLWNGHLVRDQLSKEWLEHSFSKRSFSATQLESYAFCPILFFFEHILKSAPVEEGEEFLTPRDRGIVIHQILYRFYRDLKESERSLDKLLEIAEKELEKIPVPGGLLWEIEKEFYIGSDQHTGLLPTFWSYEKENSKLYSTYPVNFEFAFGLPKTRIQPSDPFSSPSPFCWINNGKEFRLRGKIDRIEVSTDGTLLVVDYKTGKLPTLKEMWQGEKLQLPLYLKVAQFFLDKEKKHSIGGGAVYSLKKEQAVEKKVIFADPTIPLGKIIIPKSASFPNDKYKISDQMLTLEEFLERCLNFASSYIHSIQMGNFPQTPDKRHCLSGDKKICHFWPLCRRNLID